MTGWRFSEYGYVDLMIFLEIWSEHYPIDREQKRVGELLLNTFLVAVSNATRYALFSIVELDRPVKRYPIEIKETAHTLETDALWVNLHSSFASTFAFRARLIRWNVSRSFWSWRLPPPLESKSQPFYWYIVCGGSLKTTRVCLFLEDTHEGQFGVTLSRSSCLKPCSVYIWCD